MHNWALACLTVALALCWKVLTALDSLYPPAFWHAVIGPDPIRGLGQHGAMMLALYIPGVVAFCLVSACLVAVGQVWRARLFPL